MVKLLNYTITFLVSIENFKAKNKSKQFLNKPSHDFTKFTWNTLTDYHLKTQKDTGKLGIRVNTSVTKAYQNTEQAP